MIERIKTFFVYTRLDSSQSAYVRNGLPEFPTRDEPTCNLSYLLEIFMTMVRVKGL